MRKLNAFLVVGIVSMLALASSAFAAPGDPPSFDANDLAPAMNDYATTLLTGIVVLVGVVLVAAAAFTLLKIGVRTIKKWFGASKATSAI